MERENTERRKAVATPLVGQPPPDAIMKIGPSPEFEAWQKVGDEALDLGIRLASMAPGGQVFLPYLLAKDLQDGNYIGATISIGLAGFSLWRGLRSSAPSRLFGHNEYVVADAAHAARVRQGLEAYYRQHAPPGATIRWVDNLPGGRNGALNTRTGVIELSNDLLTPQYRHLADGVLMEELQHFHQLQSRGWIGRNLTAAEQALIEREVVQRIERSGFRIFDPRRP